jgi:hypothetical protein
VLAGHREQIPEQGALVIAETLGDLVVGRDRRGAGLEPDLRVAVRERRDPLVALVRG